jgi:hypothetical protein
MTIPEQAVEAAARFLRDTCCRKANGRDIEKTESLELGEALVTLVTPHIVALPSLVGVQCREDVARLRDALEPFAKAAEYAELDEADGYPLYGSSARHELTIGHLRTARAVLALPLHTGQPQEARAALIAEQRGEP